jgi:heme/copper-type cytochrome/quinol oxidase subunit 2
MHGVGPVEFPEIGSLMEGKVPTLNASTIKAAGEIDPINLAILIIGVIALACIWLAAIAIRGHKRDKSDE